MKNMGVEDESSNYATAELSLTPPIGLMHIDIAIRKPGKVVINVRSLRFSIDFEFDSSSGELLNHTCKKLE